MTSLPEYVEQKLIVTPFYRDAMMIAERFAWGRHEWRHVSRRYDLYGRSLDQIIFYRTAWFDTALREGLEADVHRLMKLRHGDHYMARIATIPVPEAD